MSLSLLTALAAAAEPAAPRPEAVARGLRFLMGGYTAVWVILAAYLLSLSVRLRRIAQQVRRLRERAGIEDPDRLPSQAAGRPPR